MDAPPAPEPADQRTADQDPADPEASTAIVVYTDHETWAVLDDALEQLATRRGLNMANEYDLLSLLASLARQATTMLEQAVEETEIGSPITIEEIAGLLTITTDEARRRYLPPPTPPDEPAF